MNIRTIPLSIVCAILACSLSACTPMPTRCSTGLCKKSHNRQPGLLQGRSRKIIDTAALGVATGAAIGSVAGAALIGGVAGTATGLAWISRNPAKHLQKLGGSIMYTDGHITATAPTDKLFEINSADFQPSASSVLNSICTLLKHYPHDNIQIAGNTDPIALGSYARDVSLSLAQAKVVYEYCVQKGLPLNSETRHITYMGNGPSQPIASNDNFAGMAKNRRIQIDIYPPCWKKSSKLAPVFPIPPIKPVKPAKSLK